MKTNTLFARGAVAAGAFAIAASMFVTPAAAQPKPKNYKKPETNGADVAADILLKALDKPPKKPRGRPKAKF